jgi:hypothetical protein
MLRLRSDITTGTRMILSHTVENVARLSISQSQRTAKLVTSAGNASGGTSNIYANSVGQ